MNICYFGTYDKTYTSNKFFLQALKENNVSVLEINAHTEVTKLTTTSEMSWLQIIKRMLRKYRIFSEIIKHCKELKNVDVIYVGYPGHVDVFLAYIVAKIFRKKLVFNPLLLIYVGFSEEQSILNKKSLLGKVIKTGETLAYKLCDIVFADTPYQEKFLKEDFGINQKKLRVLPIGADNTFYKYTPITTNVSKKLTVVYYGLYSPIHGVQYLVDAANILKDDKDISFIFIGQGNTFEKNYSRAQQLKLTNITFIHDVPQSEHPQYMEKADVFLGFLAKHPSVKRVIANKIYQGMALGKVVLTADAAVARSVFSHKENMYLVKPADPKAIVRALIELKSNPALRIKIAENGHKMFIKEFTPKAVGKQLVKYIEEIL